MEDGTGEKSQEMSSNNKIGNVKYEKVLYDGTTSDVSCSNPWPKNGSHSPSFGLTFLGWYECDHIST